MGLASGRWHRSIRLRQPRPGPGFRYTGNVQQLALTPVRCFSTPRLHPASNPRTAGAPGVEWAKKDREVGPGLLEQTPARLGAPGRGGEGGLRRRERARLAERGKGRAGGRAVAARVTLPEPAAEAAGLSRGGDGARTSLCVPPRSSGLASPRPAAALVRPRRVSAGVAGRT